MMQGVSQEDVKKAVRAIDKNLDAIDAEILRHVYMRETQFYFALRARNIVVGYARYLEKYGKTLFPLKYYQDSERHAHENVGKHTTMIKRLLEEKESLWGRRWAYLIF